MYQQDMIMSLVNTEITSTHCDTIIFFPHPQGIIYHFEDNYRSRMFYTKVFNSFFYMQTYLEMHVYPYPMLLVPNNAGSPNLKIK